MSPCEWQRKTITHMLKAQYDSHPQCAQIVGDDFNHRDWHNSKHPVTRTFLTDLHFTNPAYDEAHNSDNTNPIPITFTHHKTWIDHILHAGWAVMRSYRDYKTDLITT